MMYSNNILWLDMGMGPTQDSCPSQVHKTPIGGGRVGLGPTWVNLNSAPFTSYSYVGFGPTL